MNSSVTHLTWHRNILSTVTYSSVPVEMTMTEILLILVFGIFDDLPLQYYIILYLSIFRNDIMYIWYIATIHLTKSNDDINNVIVSYDIKCTLL